jgi:hypothetical protein
MASTADTNLAKILVYGGSTRSGTLSGSDIGTILDTEANVYYGAAMIALSEAANAVETEKGIQKVGDLSISNSGDYLRYRAIYTNLRRRAAARAKPFAGGISVAEKDTEAGDTDRPDPVFWWGQFGNPSGGSSS